MKPLLIVLLTASVIANIVLGLRTGTSVSSTSTGTHSPEDSNPTAVASATKRESSSAVGQHADKRPR